MKEGGRVERIKKGASPVLSKTKVSTLGKTFSGERRNRGAKRRLGIIATKKKGRR